MNNIAQDSTEDNAPAVVLGRVIRAARKQQRWSIAVLAEKLGRQREWLNRVELGYSEFGEYPPLPISDLKVIYELLGHHFTLTEDEAIALAKQAEAHYAQLKVGQPKARRQPNGKLTHTEVIIGEQQIVDAITELVEEQHGDAIIRNTGIKTKGTYLAVTDVWKGYREALGNFLADNPNAVFKRVEYAASPEHLAKAKDADARVAGPRRVSEVHNARVKFHRQNPLQLHAIIGQREAILALPQVSGQAGSNIAIVVRDKIFVEALRNWYDEVLWNAPGESQAVDYANFEDSFEDIKAMYGYE